MKAIIYDNYGSPDVLALRDIPKPAPKDDEILVRIHASTVTPVDCSFRSADPCIVRFFVGLWRPKVRILGSELAGEVAAIGRNVTRFKVGDRIFAATADGQGAHAQYMCLPQDGAQIAMPANMSFDQAASICNGALTALPFLRDSAGIKRGQKVLINGAAGSIGIFAVQLAKIFGAEVTGVCSGRNTDLVKSLGADHVIDYTKEDFTRNGQVYDIIFDTVGKSSFAASKKALTDNGFYLSTVPTFASVMQFIWTRKRNGKKAVLSATGLRPAPDQIKDMIFLKDLIEAGKLKTIIDRSYPMEQVAKAHWFVETGHKRGNVVLTIAHGDSRAAA